ncbi:MAG TPA: hypothetical protein VG938_09550 [Verrucomicrobiae bacterium]|jgi:uncharacterized delta-60 repeat protein|nr:hypothetical protein [Verrucomicrobiae bacterium]
MKTKAGFGIVAVQSLCAFGFIANGSTPSISYPPRDQTVILYQQTAFGVIAHGTPPLSYQWLKNGAPVPNATNDQIVFEHAQFTDEGCYSVVLSNSDGSITSTNAALTIRLPKAGDVDGSLASGGGMIDGTVRSAVIQPNGKVLIGGDFTIVHGAVRGGIARLNVDGTTDETFLNGVSGAGGGINNDGVNSIALQADGGIIIGGAFRAVNGVPCGGIARLNADGSLDGTFKGYVSGTINSMAVQSDGKIIIGGDFWQTNDSPPYHLARLNSDGTLDASFAPVLDESGVYIQSVALQSDGKVLIAGYFSTVDGVSRNALARLNPDGTLDNTFQNPTLTISGYPNVGALAVQNDGKILIGGSFVNVDGYARGNLARLNSDGSLDTNFNPNLPTSTSVYVSVKTIVVQSDGKIVVGGDFTELDDTYNLARFNADGTTDETLNPLANGGVYVVAVQSDGKVVIGGSFTLVEGMPQAYVARLDGNTVDAGFQNGVSGGPDRLVSSLAVETGGTILIGGGFDQVNGLARSGVARLNPDGSLTGFSPDIGLNPANNQWIDCVAPLGGEVLVGGNFELPEDPYLENGLLGLLNGSGYPDTSVGVFGGKSDAVPALVVQSNSTAYAAAYTSDYYGQTSVRLYRITPNSSSYQVNFFGPFLPTYSIVLSMALQRDGKLLVGGYFGYSNCVSIVRLNADGSFDSTFQCAVVDSNSQPNDPGSVDCIAVQKDGKIVIAGFFPQVSGSNCQSIARLNSDGTLDTSFHSPFIYSTEIDALALQDDGKMIVASDWLERLNSDGSVDDSFQGYSPTSMVLSTRAVAIQPDGKILVGCGMTSIHGVPTGYLTRLWASDFPPVLKNLTCTETNVNLTWHGISNRTYRVQYTADLATNDWKDLAGDICATNDIAGKTDTTCCGAKQRFYRVLQLP